MKHPVRDRALILLCALLALLGGAGCVAVVLKRVSITPLIEVLTRLSLLSFRARVALIVAAVVLVLLGLLLIGITLPSRKKRSSNFAIQQNENGMVRISLKALESLVQRCLNQHAELKVITSSLFSDEETIRVDVHIVLQSDISMPLAISALQKQIKRYLEACSGVTVEEVRVFVDGTTPPSDKGEASPYAIPQSLLGIETDALPAAQQTPAATEPEAAQEDTADAAPAAQPVEADEPQSAQDDVGDAVETAQEETDEEAQGSEPETKDEVEQTW